MGTESIYDLFRKVQAHPDYVAGAIFTRGDFPYGAGDYGKALEEGMVQAGFEAADAFGIETEEE